MEYIDELGKKVIIEGDQADFGFGIRRRIIGANYVFGVQFGGYLSSFDRSFTDERIGIESGLGDIVLSKIGDVGDAYELLREKISNVDSSNIFEIAQAVLETVDEYFGGLENHKDRLNYYYTEDYEESKDNKISNLKGKGAAMCVERAALSQNLLQLLGIRSFFKTSGIVKNGSNEAHSYNLIEYEGKYYIFDSTMPNMINNAPNPLIAEIDKESFDLITSPLAKTGISISTSHYNPYFSKNYEVTYDAAREKKIEVPALGNDAKQL